MAKTTQNFNTMKTTHRKSKRLKSSSHLKLNHDRIGKKNKKAPYTFTKLRPKPRMRNGADISFAFAAEIQVMKNHGIAMKKSLQQIFQAFPMYVPEKTDARRSEKRKGKLKKSYQEETSFKNETLFKDLEKIEAFMGDSLIENISFLNSLKSGHSKLKNICYKWVETDNQMSLKSKGVSQIATNNQYCIETRGRSRGGREAVTDDTTRGKMATKSTCAETTTSKESDEQKVKGSKKRKREISDDTFNKKCNRASDEKEPTKIILKSLRPRVNDSALTGELNCQTEMVGQKISSFNSRPKNTRAEQGSLIRCEKNIPEKAAAKELGSFLVLEPLGRTTTVCVGSDSSENITSGKRKRKRTVADSTAKKQRVETEKGCDKTLVNELNYVKEKQNDAKYENRISKHRLKRKGSTEGIVEQEGFQASHAEQQSTEPKQNSNLTEQETMVQRDMEGKKKCLPVSEGPGVGVGLLGRTRLDTQNLRSACVPEEIKEMIDTGERPKCDKAKRPKDVKVSQPILSTAGNGNKGISRQMKSVNEKLSNSSQIHRDQLGQDILGSTRSDTQKLRSVSGPNRHNSNCPRSSTQPRIKNEKILKSTQSQCKVSKKVTKPNKIGEKRTFQDTKMKNRKMTDPSEIKAQPQGIIGSTRSDTRKLKTVCQVGNQLNTSVVKLENVAVSKLFDTHNSAAQHAEGGQSPGVPTDHSDKRQSKPDIRNEDHCNVLSECKFVEEKSLCSSQMEGNNEMLGSTRSDTKTLKSVCAEKFDSPGSGNSRKRKGKDIQNIRATKKSFKPDDDMTKRPYECKENCSNLKAKKDFMEIDEKHAALSEETVKGDEITAVIPTETDDEEMSNCIESERTNRENGLKTQCMNQKKRRRTKFLFKKSPSSLIHHEKKAAVACDKRKWKMKGCADEKDHKALLTKNANEDLQNQKSNGKKGNIFVKRRNLVSKRKKAFMDMKCKSLSESYITLHIKNYKSVGKKFMVRKKGKIFMEKRTVFPKFKNTEKKCDSLAKSYITLHRKNSKSGGKKFMVRKIKDATKKLLIRRIKDSLKERNLKLSGEVTKKKKRDQKKVTLKRKRQKKEIPKHERVSLKHAKPYTFTPKASLTDGFLNLHDPDTKSDDKLGKVMSRIEQDPKQLEILRNKLQPGSGCQKRGLIHKIFHRVWKKINKGIESPSHPDYTTPAELTEYICTDQWQEFLCQSGVLELNTGVEINFDDLDLHYAGCIDTREVKWTREISPDLEGTAGNSVEENIAPLLEPTPTIIYDLYGTQQNPVTIQDDTTLQIGQNFSSTGLDYKWLNQDCQEKLSFEHTLTAHPCKDPEFVPPDGFIHHQPIDFIPSQSLLENQDGNLQFEWLLSQDLGPNSAMDHLDESPVDIPTLEKLNQEYPHDQDTAPKGFSNALDPEAEFITVEIPDNIELSGASNVDGKLDPHSAQSYIPTAMLKGTNKCRKEEIPPCGCLGKGW